ncbi:hypothetical protein J6590_058005 [Homalodisca vitripennis]|nr:hypothetical protein J6590_058005 [Homalodisca vitripennis]
MQGVPHFCPNFKSSFKPNPIGLSGPTVIKSQSNSKFNSLNLKTNTSKTNVINFTLRHVDSQFSPAAILAESILEEVYSSKFLGIHLDVGLTWNDHVDHV